MSRIPIRSHFPNPLGESSRESSRESPACSENFVVLLILLLAPLMLLLGTGVMVISSLTQVSENLEKTLEPLGNRQIILDVPESSRVNAQVTSGDNTVNLQNL